MSSKIHEVDTFYADIYVGFQEEYSGRVPAFAREISFKICSAYCDRVGLGLTFTDTEFIYVKGNEPGIKIGLINYPRYPSTNEEIVAHALRIAESLKRELNQHRISIVTPVKTYLLGELE